jgi:hypothetical protein
MQPVITRILKCATPLNLLTTRLATQLSAFVNHGAVATELDAPQGMTEMISFENLLKQLNPADSDFKKMMKDERLAPYLAKIGAENIKTIFQMRHYKDVCLFRVKLTA